MKDKNFLKTMIEKKEELTQSLNELKTARQQTLERVDNIQTEILRVEGAILFIENVESELVADKKQEEVSDEKNALE